MRRLLALRYDNPVLVKELRARMRGRAFVVQGFYVALLAVVVGWAYYDFTAGQAATSMPQVISGMGHELFQVLVGLQGWLLLLLTPAFAAGAITIEREQRTYELLAASRLPARSVVLGKLLGSWLYVVMLLTCGLPLAAMCMMWGGVSAEELVWSYVLLCLHAFLLAALAVCCSALANRSSTAVVGTYAIVGLSTMVQLTTAHAGPSFSAFRWRTPLTVQDLAPVPFFATTAPVWVATLLFVGLTSTVLVAWAATRLPYFVPRGAAALRLVLPLAVLVGVFAPAASLPAEFMAYGLLLLPLVALFVTGDGPAGPRPPRTLAGWLLGGLWPPRLFHADQRGGWLYALLLLGVVPAALALHRHFGSTTVSLAAHAKPLYLLPAAIALCYAALGALGGALGSRRLGLVLVAGMILVGLAAPLAVVGQVDTTMGGQDMPPAALLAPYMSLADVSPTLVKSARGGSPPPVRPDPVWPRSARLYLILAGVWLVLAEITWQVRRPALLPHKNDQNAGGDDGERSPGL